MWEGLWQVGVEPVYYCLSFPLSPVICPTSCLTHTHANTQREGERPQTHTRTHTHTLSYCCVLTVDSSLNKCIEGWREREREVFLFSQSLLSCQAGSLQWWLGHFACAIGKRGIRFRVTAMGKGKVGNVFLTTWKHTFPGFDDVRSQVFSLYWQTLSSCRHSSTCTLWSWKPHEITQSIQNAFLS